MRAETRCGNEKTLVNDRGRAHPRVSFFAGEISKWLKGVDCKSIRFSVRGFESLSHHHFLDLFPAFPPAEFALCGRFSVQVAGARERGACRSLTATVPRRIFCPPMEEFSAATAALRAALGENVVRTDAESRFAASFDNTKISFLPEAVVFPRDEADIAEMLRRANAARVPVTVRGAGTGTTGAPAPICGGWVISLAHWTALEIDAASLTATVQPGVITQKISDAAAEVGLFYPPDPASVKHCSIGGNIATNAGGLHAAKYGVTRDYVLALEGFLPTGEKVRWGGAVKKYVSGYNLRDLWIGSEGMLGIVTKAVLRLAPLPQARHTFLCAFPSDADALRAAQLLPDTRVVPSVCEFLDTLSVVGAERLSGKHFFEKASAVLLVEVDGDAQSVPEQAARVRNWARGNASEFRETSDADEAESLWEVRRVCSQAMFLIADSKLNEDVVVPAKNFIPLLDSMRRITAETGLETPIFGHAADGNLHVHVMYHRLDVRERTLAQVAIRRVMETVVALGGVITGEHGIGLAKSPFLAIQHSPAEIAAMRAVKRALDPNNILGRGKMFEPFNIWDCEPVQVVLPWDKPPPKSGA